MVALLLVSWGTSILFSMVVTSVCIPTNNVGGFPFLLLNLIFISHQHILSHLMSIGSFLGPQMISLPSNLSLSQYCNPFSEIPLHIFSISSSPFILLCILFQMPLRWNWVPIPFPSWSHLQLLRVILVYLFLELLQWRWIMAVSGTLSFVSGE